MSELTVPSEDLSKLLGAASGDAALLYLCRLQHSDPATCGLYGARLSAATALLEQLGLIRREPPRLQQSDEHPAYTEADVTRRMNEPKSGFRELVGETQRRLGRILSSEELKILLSMTDYLGLSAEVISVLFSYCIGRSRSRGNVRTPSFRTFEKEAYCWADAGIDNIEAAAAYVQAQAIRHSVMGELCHMMGLDGRRLTQGEEKYLLCWLDWGFGVPELQLAYEKTCMNTGGLKWPYMNSIVQSWNSKGLHTLAQIQSSDKPPQGKKPAAYQLHGEPLSPISKRAVAQLLAEEQED